MVGGCIILPLVLVGLVGCLAILGSLGGGGRTPGGSGSGMTFTKENYTDLIADPDGNRGASVDMIGKVFRPPEVRENESVFQMWADPKNAEGNMMIRTDPGAAKVNTNDYVRVQGTVLDSLEGENAFGGNIAAVEIDADSVEKADPAEALDQAQKTTQVGQTRQDKGFSITVDKVEFGQEITKESRPLVRLIPQDHFR